MPTGKTGTLASTNGATAAAGSSPALVAPSESTITPASTPAGSWSITRARASPSRVSKPRGATRSPQGMSEARSPPATDGSSPGVAAGRTTIGSASASNRHSDTSCRGASASSSPPSTSRSIACCD
ncbi:MAG: hypothetical protein ACKOYJ_12045, partial [Planctomycetia bacterium]